MGRSASLLLLESQLRLCLLPGAGRTAGCRVRHLTCPTLPVLDTAWAQAAQRRRVSQGRTGLTETRVQAGPPAPAPTSRSAGNSPAAPGSTGLPSPGCEAGIEGLSPMWLQGLCQPSHWPPGVVRSGGVGPESWLKDSPVLCDVPADHKSRAGLSRKRAGRVACAHAPPRCLSVER